MLAGAASLQRCRYRGALLHKLISTLHSSNESGKRRGGNKIVHPLANIPNWRPRVYGEGDQERRPIVLKGTAFVSPGGTGSAPSLPGSSKELGSLAPSTPPLRGSHPLFNNLALNVCCKYAVRTRGTFLQTCHYHE